ncbi:MAG: DUF167 domain-containing protein [Rhodospirillales bacterium]|nr:DUF167 domain-containing protein [Rhodospirillales bacterium]
MAEPLNPFRAVAGGVLVVVRLTPKAGRSRVGPVVAGADGGGVLKVAVTEAPERGKANAALIGLLAKTWRLPKGAIAVARGATDRNKILRIEGAPASLMGTLMKGIAGNR